MVQTRNQATNTPNAERLVSIPTVYRPSTPGGRPIIEPMPGTHAQPSNGEQMRVTRSGIYHAPIPTGNRRPTPSTRRAPGPVNLSSANSPIQDTTSQRISSFNSSGAGIEKTEEMSTEATAQGDMPTSSAAGATGNITGQLNDAAEQGAKRALGDITEFQGAEKKLKLDPSPSPHEAVIAGQSQEDTASQHGTQPNETPSGDAVTHEAAITKQSQQDTASLPGTQPDELLNDNKTGDNVAEDATMFDDLSDIIDLNSPCPSPSYSPVLKPETIQQFKEARLQQAFEEAELLIDNTNLFPNEPGFKIRDHTMDQDPTLPSSLNYEHDDPRLAQWREDLSLGPNMDPFTGELERETEWRVKMEKAKEEAEYKRK